MPYSYSFIKGKKRYLTIKYLFVYYLQHNILIYRIFDMKTQLTDKELISLNHNGFIPGPEEDTAVFLARVARSTEASTFDDEAIPSSHYKKAFETTQSLFDHSPSWMSGFYSNESLAPWHGATTWIATDEEGITTSFIQLRKAFQHSERFLGIYHRDEILAHEAVHLGRSAFSGSSYEEIFAYMTSSSLLRRFLGPIASSLWSIILFFAVIFAILGIDIYLLATGNFATYETMMWAKLLPITMIASAIGRLFFLRRRLKRCVATLKKIITDPTKALAVAYRLTDDEIAAFAKNSPDEATTYSRDQRSLRWKMINVNYLQNKEEI